jgi:hypothetical protein
MGIGYTRNDTTNNIANGNVISAADLDGEFDAIVSAFVNTTGHTHDGTTAEGGAVSVLGPVQEYLGDGTAFYPKTTAVYTLGKASNVWSNLYLTTLTLGGTAVTSTAAELNKLDGYTGTFSDLNKIAAVTATAAELNVLDGVAPTLTFTELNYVDGVTSAIQTQLNNKQPLSAVLTATTASFLLADETKLDAIEALADVTDVTNVTAAGALMDSELTNLAAVKAINQSLVTTASPTFNQGNFTTVDTANLEVTTLKARDGVAAGGIASVTGVTTLNSAVLTTADINGGTVDGASIGATTRSTGLFTTLGTNGLATLASVDINGGNIDATAIGAATRSTGLFTTLGTNSLATLASVDINGGNIDGTVIGAATPAAVTTSSLVATTADINGGTFDGIVGGTTPAAGTFTALTSNGIDDNAAATAVTIDATGRVGIGETAPSYPLEIKGASDTYMQLVTPNNTGASGLFFGDSDASGVGRVTYTHANNNMLFHTNSTTRMVIDDTGRVGIGTTTPDSALDIDTGSASATAVTLQGAAATSAKLQLGLGMFSAGYPTVLGTANGLDLGTSASAPIRLFVNSSEKMRLLPAGTICLGGTTSGTQGALTIEPAYSTGSGNFVAPTPMSYHNRAGSASIGTAVLFQDNGITKGSIIYSNSSTSYLTTSDYRLKENVMPIEGAGDIVKAMRPATYNFIGDDQWHDGFIADELQELHPRVVTGDKDAVVDEEYEVTPAVLDEDGNTITEAVMGTRSVPDYQQVDYSKLTPILTAALKEALLKIDDLTARIVALEATQ